MHDSKSPSWMLWINSWCRCSISVFPCTPSDVFFEYCYYCPNASSNSSSAICFWRFFCVCFVWSLLLKIVLNLSPSYPSIKAWVCKVSNAAQSNWRKIYLIGMGFTSFRICLPPNSARYFPSIEKNAQVMGNGPSWMKILSCVGFSSACNCIATLATARS